MSCGLLPLSASGRGLGGGVIAAAFCLPLLDPAAVRPVDFAFRPHQPQHVSCRRTTAQRIAEEEQLAMASWQRRIGFKVDVAGIDSPKGVGGLDLLEADLDARVCPLEAR